ncbi:RnaseH [uncultured Caudovirales phage]|jgi:5'-3' exonuclease|uniref:RnaseH n=1 Tax=uncultured Caudovirales phage TaxID=2100421 RepID=A0A6J5LDF0_9CAUD|nr:RnaseH [uncultured Caudovirales phage]
MIIVDFNQVVLSNLMMSLGNHTNAQIEENMVRHMVLNALRAFKVKFGDEFGELVVACDNTNVWRKQIYPYYKANRKKSQEKSELDWKSIFECLNKIRQELKDNFPYRIIDVESAEADDVIATLVKYKHDEQNILIMSGDKDFIQLHKYDGVQQYDPVRKRKIAHDNPKRYLVEHILKGDSGDGIPNVLSPDNCFVVGERQKPMTAKKIAQYLTSDPSTIEDPIVLRNYHRNQQLIDLSFVPSYIEDKVLEQYDSQKGKDRSKLMNYFINNKLKNLMEHMSEF